MLTLRSKHSQPSFKYMLYTLKNDEMSKRKALVRDTPFDVVVQQCTTATHPQEHLQTPGKQIDVAPPLHPAVKSESLNGLQGLVNLIFHI